VGKRYQVFAVRDADGRMGTSICAGTQAIGRSETPFGQDEPAASLQPGRGEGPAPTETGRPGRGAVLGSGEGEGRDGDGTGAEHAAERTAERATTELVRDYLVAGSVWLIIGSMIWALLRRRRGRAAA
jgi:hypothetical protein